jgi:ABC-type phosphate/phosphonate transport system substrate-binding protein
VSLRDRSPQRVRAILTSAILAVAAVSVVFAQTPAGERILRYGFSSTLLEDVNTNDALAASTVWVRAVGRVAGVYDDVQATAFPDLASLVRASDTTDLFALSTTDYLSIERTLAADPCMVYVSNGVVDVEYVLIAKAGSSSLASFRGQRFLSTTAAGPRAIGDQWLDVLLMEAGLPERSRFWPDAKQVQKGSQAVNQLYFGQADVAMVTRSAFDTSAEMNPDVARKLTVVARSPRLLPGLICARRSMPQDTKRRYIETATTIHERTQFKQTFVVLHMNRLAVWDPHYLDTARAIVAQREVLRRKVSAK